MTLFRSFTLTAVVAALVAGGAVAAQGPGRRGPAGQGGAGGPGVFGGRGGPGGPGGLPLRELNLTDSQQQLVRDITQQYRDQNQKVAGQLSEAMEARREAVETMPIDEGLIRSTTQALVEAQTEMAIQRARMHSEIFAILTTTQQAQAKKLQADREARIDQRERREPRRPPQQ